MTLVPSLAPVTLVLGGARSGKSRFAEQLVEAEGGGLYLASAEAGDAEMAERIRRHQERRGNIWETIEEPLEIAATLVAKTQTDRPILVDCLTIWLSNLLGAGRDPDAEGNALVAVLRGLAGPVVLVSNEVGLGVVPDNPLARQFIDCAGRLNQVVAETADRVVLIAAGIPTTLKNVER